MNETIQFVNEQVVQQSPANCVQREQYDIDYLYTFNTCEEHYYFLNQKIKELNLMYRLLGYENENVLEIGIDVITNCILQKKIDVKISRTGEGELLLYREIGRSFNNIIIDEDGDIEFLHIPEERQNTFNEFHPFLSGVEIKGLVSKL